MSENTPSREAMQAASKICAEFEPREIREAAKIIDSAFSTLREENKRLREALELARDHLVEIDGIENTDECPVCNEICAVLSGKDSP